MHCGNGHLAECLNEARLTLGKQRGNEQKKHKTGTETYIDSPY